MPSSIEPGPPDANELEVSIFGPGKGECIAVHIGAAEWIVVDSCRDQTTQEQPAVAYLRSIGVDLASQVKLVVATHAHDNHISGIAELFRDCSSAILTCSSALTSEEFYASVKADASIEGTLRKSVRKEYRALLEELKTRPLVDGRIPGRHAYEQRILWTRLSGLPAKVVALSPSDEAVNRANALLAEGSATVGSRRRLAASDPNEFAVALRVEVGQDAVLLGADLLHGPAACGWTAVLGTPAQPQASLVKVPHHGAPNAHHPGMWSDLLVADPLALLAPYRAGVTRRPSPEDVARLKGSASRVYATADPALHKQSARTRRVGADLAGVAANVREIWGRPGHVQARRRPGADWRTATQLPALRL